MFSPTPEDAQRYRQLRTACMGLNNKMVPLIPRRAFEEIGEAIGMLRNGVLVVNSRQENVVLMDCCLYDWYRDGKNLVQRYAEAHPAPQETDEGYVLQACTQATYRILQLQFTVPGAGVHCRDVNSNETLFLMDIGLSRSDVAGVLLATRTIPLGQYWISTGAELPLPSKEEVLGALDAIECEAPDWLESPGGSALLAVCTCLDAGAASMVRYRDLPGLRDPAPTAGKSAARAATRRRRPRR